MKNTTPIPHSVVCELLGSVSFTKGQERDVMMAEAIAGGTYNSMSDLISTIDGQIEVKKYKKEWDNTKLTLPSNPFFAPYFLSDSK